MSQFTSLGKVWRIISTLFFFPHYRWNYLFYKPVTVNLMRWHGRLLIDGAVELSLSSTCSWRVWGPRWVMFSARQTILNLIPFSLTSKMILCHWKVCRKCPRKWSKCTHFSEPIRPALSSMLADMISDHFVSIFIGACERNHIQRKQINYCNKYQCWSSTHPFPCFSMMSSSLMIGTLTKNQLCS